MTSSQEKLPLLQNEGSTSDNHNNSQSLFPPISPKKSNSLSYYGVIEINPENVEIRRRKEGGIITNPIVAVIAVTVGLILILTITATTGYGNRQLNSATTNLEENLSTNLKAVAPDQQQKLSQTQSPPGYIDIEIPQGRLRGYKRLSRQKREYAAFYKVPYASPPLGSLRFKDPVPALSWSGLRDIPVVAPQCIQKEKYSPTVQAVGEEDCLYANIYTPRLPKTSGSDETSNTLLPVMVYIHGGGLSGNGSRYGAEYFMDEDVVIITFQYRIGAFGLLSTGDDVIRGNMAFKDQVEILKWVRDNAKYFNGDPNLVTIFGNSNGGMNVGQVMISPMSNGLFHRAISQSGTSLCYSVSDQINEVAVKGTMEEVGKVLQCDTNDSQRFLDCLKEKDASDIALLQTPSAVYSLTVEDRDGPETTKFMPAKPYDMLKSGRVNPVPYMAGCVNAEWYTDAIKILLDANSTKAMNERFEDFGYLFNLNLTKNEMMIVKEFYFGEERISNRTLRGLGDLYSDRVMVHCAYTTARFHAARNADTYLYWLTKPPALSYVEKEIHGFPAKELGMVFHADELQFLFLYDGYPEIPEGSEDFEYSKYLVKLWTHFAKTGNPNMDGENEWPPVNSFNNGFANSTHWFELGDNPAITTTPQQRMGFWDGFKHSQLLYDY